ncbi:SusD/RagB family nutrient-binding outer membrane lipoprotein [Pedobacter sp. UYP1]|uniref:SusD/RagB family nutrient-binding outer membrane lipoprotein n=1 Tax=Pedobacter sp. UYP1 TaxID=1756396 RepID=UPI0033936DB2
MKTQYMIRNGYKYALSAFLALTVLTFAGCKKDFEKYNTDNTGIGSGKFQIGLVYPGIQASVFGGEGDYQLNQNLNADCYSGYMMSPNPFRGNISNLNYSLVDGWNQNVFVTSFTNSLFAINSIGKAGTRTTLPDFWAIALILKVEIMNRVTDKFGPIAYTAAGKTLMGTPYDSQQAVYKQFFLELDTAVTNLNTYIKANPAQTPFKQYDLVYGGDYTKWLKFANSLRLRLAMHIVKVDAATAQAQAQKALDPASGGVLTVNADNAGISGGGTHNPLEVITTSWTDIALGAPIETYLVGYKDPRLPVYATPAKDTRFAGQYKGIRIGSIVTAKPGYNGYSLLNSNTIVTSNSPMMMMTAAEVWFLKAEAALRGWTGAGDAQTNYTTGIQTSLAQWNVTNSTYINDETSLPTAYVDPGNAANNSPAVSTITVKWDGAAANEQKLERIITQKWIAMFPEGQEAWTEYRRTGYPKLFPVVTNNSNGTIDSKIQIRRLAFPQNEYSSNGTEIAKAVQLLNGPDNGGTRLWWDVNKANF